ncbi:uncharacterized protein LOC114261054 [Camellia sinensis]|uniref:uncharacterized protein LOC114261054 n=1 Tax=Camellia sinensis TaxID=4442 RepID=UPI00103626E6|nr:uncharacterized protein LOC114261054 [Camellia sinensis]
MVLVEDHNADANEDQNCIGCTKPILGIDPIYSCNECSLFLHKSCAELPKETNHPAHPQHPLSLLFEPHLTQKCDSCFENWGNLLYYCSLSEFKLDIHCATLPNTIEHIGHNHPLPLQLKQASFSCDACGKPHNYASISYQCTTCYYWVHHDCVSLPNSVAHSSHNHPLTLSNAFQLEFSKFKLYCDICSEVVNQKNCVYSCAGCRYVAHVNWTKEEEIDEHVDEKSANEEIDECINFNFFIDEKNEGDEPEPSDPVCLPMADSSVNLANHLLQQLSRKDNSKPTTLEQIYHDHPLTLFEVYSGRNREQISNELKNTEMCNSCLELISAPYYGCSESDCDFLLHKYCADLPSKIQHPLHPKHTLNLLTSCCISCNACDTLCNTFAYQCGECYNFNIDVKCVSFPLTIRHDAHEHVLALDKDPGRAHCNACQKEFGGYALRCSGRHCNFNLHIGCASLPRTVKHRYDKHALVLTYCPLDKEYCCKICEKEMNPKHWFYCCADCEVGLHPDCICDLAEHLNFKFEAKNHSDHPHPLSFVRKLKDNPPPCDNCGNPCDDLAFQCEECNYNLDFSCASRFG